MTSDEGGSGEPVSHGRARRGYGRGSGNDRGRASARSRTIGSAGRRGSRGDALQGHPGGRPPGAQDRAAHTRIGPGADDPQGSTPSAWRPLLGAGGGARRRVIGGVQVSGGGQDAV